MSSCVQILTAVPGVSRRPPAMRLSPEERDFQDCQKSEGTEDSFWVGNSLGLWHWKS